MAQYLGERKYGRKKVGLRTSNKFLMTVSGIISVFALAFVASFLASSIFAPINTSNAAEATISASIASGAYTLSLTVSSDVTLDLMASPTGALTIGSGAVSIETNSPTGYRLYMNMTGTNANTNSLIHTTDTALTIPSSGSFTSPVALTNGSWGYAIPHSAPSVVSTNGFDASYATVTSGAPNSSKFAAVPTSNQDAQLIAETNSGNAGIPNQFNIYYGVQADYTTVSGSYTNKVLYTGVADAGAIHQMSVAPEETPAIDGGDPLTLTTTLFSTSDNIAANAYILTPAEYTAVSANPASISSYSASQMSCTRDTTKTYLELNCTNIAKPIGSYYVYVDIPNYGEHYATPFNYVANFYNITYMQDMTPEICNDTKYVTTPSKNVYNGTTFSDSTVHSYPRSTYADTGTATYRPAHKGDANYVPETTMKDSRNSIFYENGQYVNKQVEYTVRKLADGNCWMTENLALNYEEGREFTSSDTNIQTTKTAAHATQSLDGVVQDWEVDQPKPGVTPDTCSESTPIADRLCWSEGATAGNFSDRWLSRSSNEAKENDYADEADQTGENQNLGTYYNWYTSVMGTISSSQGEAEATEDICPKGWKLPANSGDGSWINLIKDTYGIITNNGGTQTDNRGSLVLHKFPFSIPYSGGVNRSTGAFVRQGTRGFFWATKAYSGVGVRYLYFYDSNLSPQAGAQKTNGFMVRCLAK